MLWFPLFPIIGHGLHDLSADQRRPIGEESSASSSLAGWGRVSRNSLNASASTRTVSVRFWTYSMKISICVGFRGALPPRLHWSRQVLWEPVGAGWSRYWLSRLVCSSMVYSWSGELSSGDKDVVARKAWGPPFSAKMLMSKIFDSTPDATGAGDRTGTVAGSVSGVRRRARGAVPWVTAGSGSTSEMVVIQSGSREASLADQSDLVRFAWPLALCHRS
ncbi:hypothetical protein TIFTF001_034334 [Ficus carica]|uniref:Uncharacterized protein n=1 Tax=Ficus carica TaxID=3494 RepID=A0AA88E088_FICCA|nr:hypothetical protein TIFTF001_034334 [Ficus carica]